MRREVMRRSVGETCDRIVALEDIASMVERTARRMRVTVDEGRCIGHDECGGCGATVGIADRYCRMCGTRLEDA